jgi:transposase
MAKNVVKEIRRATRRKFSAEEKIRIVLEGLRGEIPVSDLCRREGIAPTMYYRWSKTFLDSGKNGLTRDTQRDATSQEVRQLKEENESLKRALAESVLDVQRYKKAWACRAHEVRSHASRTETQYSAARGILRALRAQESATA